MKQQIVLLRKDWAKSVPAAAVIPIVQMMIYTGFKTCGAGLRKIEIFFRKSNFVKFIEKIKNKLDYPAMRKEGVKSTTKGTVKCLDISSTSKGEAA